MKHFFIAFAGLLLMLLLVVYFLGRPEPYRPLK